MPTGSFYVYALKDPRHSPARIFYIGKGVGSRDISHLVRSDNTPKGQFIEEIRKANLKPIAEMLVTDLSEADALKVEAQLIAALGTTSSGGLLLNAVIPSGRQSRARANVAIPHGAAEKAQIGLSLLQESVRSLVAANPEGLENADVTNALGLHSDHEGSSINYLSYSLLGMLLKDRSIEKYRSSSPQRTKYRPKS